MSTYFFSSSFEKPINRLVFFASWGNLGMNVAALISEAGPQTGQASALCQFQGFMVQMFLGVDAYWSLCMAINVYLVFLGHFTVRQLRHLDFRYLLGCYGLSFIPALTFIFVSTEERGRIYGDAILWCWVSIEWDFLRLALVYSVSWLSIAMALAVYCVAARVVWTKRHELQGDFMNPFNDTPWKNIITTEIDITTEPRQEVAERASVFDDSATELAGYDPYSVAVEVGPSDTQGHSKPDILPDILQMRSLTRSAATSETNTEALLYARSAFFYFVALLIIWIPSSINRAYALAHPSDFNYPLNYMSSLLLSSQKAVVGLWSDCKSLVGDRRRHSIVEIGDRSVQGRGQRLNSY
ncbi:hypothetical protein MMC13_002351 [Lambiella insularis]|nr:hypothetical protein [Lambiella insularis]